MTFKSELVGTSEVPKKENKFPKLMINCNRDIIVLFNNATSGVCVWKDRPLTVWETTSLGKYYTIWDPTVFIDYDEPIYLQNK